MCDHPYRDDRLRRIMWPVADWMFDFGSVSWSAAWILKSGVAQPCVSFSFCSDCVKFVTSFFLFLFSHCIACLSFSHNLYWFEHFPDSRLLYLRMCRIAPLNKSNKCFSSLLLVRGRRPLTKKVLSVICFVIFCRVPAWNPFHRTRDP